MQKKMLKTVPLPSRDVHMNEDPATVGGFPYVPPVITDQDEPIGGRYKFEGINDGAGVLIYAPYVEDRNPVAIELAEGGFAFVVKTKEIAKWKAQGIAYSSKILPTIKFIDILKEVSGYLIRGWKTPIEKPGFPMMHTWATQKTAASIGKRLYQYWTTVCAQIDPTVLDVQRAVFAACGPSMMHSPLLDPELYENKNLVRDVLKYRSAALLIGRPDAFGVEKPWMFENWRTAFTNSRVISKHLNKTLDALPGGVPPFIVGNIQSLNLDRPLTDRLTMIAYGYAAGLYEGSYDDLDAALNVLGRSSPEQIRRAVKMVHRNLTGVKLDMRRQKGIIENLRVIYEYYPYLHTDAARNATIVGWAEASLERHMELHEEAVREYEARRTEPTRVPPIPLPDDPNIAFLDSVGAILAEGETMRHCVGGYSNDAVNGRCFLFHVDFQGSKATVEVTSDGRVAQARGPRNRNNPAAEYGKKALKKWGRKLTKVQPLPEVYEYDIDMMPF